MKKLFLLLALATMLIGCEATNGCLLTITVDESIQNYELSLDGEPFTSGDTKTVDSGAHLIRIDMFDDNGDYVDGLNSTYYIQSYVAKVDLRYSKYGVVEEQENE